MGSYVSRSLVDQDNFIRIAKRGGKKFQVNRIIFVNGAWLYVDADIKVQFNLESLMRFRRFILRYFNEFEEKGKVWVKYATANWKDLPCIQEEIDADPYLNLSKSVDYNVREIIKAIDLE